jgi:hypothetical protein
MVAHARLRGGAPSHGSYSTIGFHVKHSPVLRELLKDAKSHETRTGGTTGYLLITFHDFDEVRFTSKADADEEFAEAILTILNNILSGHVIDDDDEIGECMGEA